MKYLYHAADITSGLKSVIASLALIPKKPQSLTQVQIAVGAALRKAHKSVECRVFANSAVKRSERRTSPKIPAFFAFAKAEKLCYYAPIKAKPLDKAMWGSTILNRTELINSSSKNFI